MRGRQQRRLVGCMRRNRAWVQLRRGRTAAEAVLLRRLRARNRYTQRRLHETFDVLGMPLRTMQAEQFTFRGNMAQLRQDRDILLTRIGYHARRTLAVVVCAGSVASRWARQRELRDELRQLVEPEVERGSAIRIYMPDTELDGRTGVVLRCLPGRYADRQAIVKMDDTKKLHFVPWTHAEDYQSQPCVQQPRAWLLHAVAS